MALTTFRRKLKYANKNDDPELLMEAAKWWIETHQLDHFEKAVKIQGMVEQGM